MADMKLYKQLSYIETYDGEIIALTEDYGEIIALLEDNSKFINLWSQLLAKATIKRVFTKEVDEIDNAILQIADKNLRARVQKEVDTRRRDWTRLNMEIYKNILDRLNN